MDRLLLTISRTWIDIDCPVRLGVLSHGLTLLYKKHPDVLLMHGDCREGDQDAARIWRELGGVDEPHPADWDVWGSAAGPLRNQDMVALKPIGYASFIHNASPGATGCRRLARKAGVPELLHVAWDEA